MISKPMSFHQGIDYVVVKSEGNNEPILKAFRDCAEQAQDVEHFRVLIQSTLAKDVPFQAFVQSATAVGQIANGGHLFMIHRRNG